MSRVYVFGDESGDFVFGGKPGSSSYFLVATATLRDESLPHELAALRRELQWQGIGLERGFHAGEDSWPVRNQVYDLIAAHDFRVDATILEKSKARAQIRESNLRFWQTSWFYHLHYLAPRVADAGDALMVIAAALDTGMRRDAVRAALVDVVSQVSPARESRSLVVPAAVEPGLQVADYCAWAIQRKWETGNTDAFSRIEDKVASEFDLFSRDGRG